MKASIGLSLATAIFVSSLCLDSMAQDVPGPGADKDLRSAQKPLIQIALLLDTSGSMSGMIKQAQTQLWAIVNEFATAKQDGVAPRLQVALYHYGTPALGSENGFIKQLTPLTDDLDKVSAELFKLTTNGGDEYCGWVIRTAVNELQWSTGRNDYKAIFIAGNEPFTQGPVAYRESCKSAISKGIIVNTIHCQGGSNEGWRDGALLADGQYMSIDMNQAVVEIETPFDKQLAELNVKLNVTYIAYGQEGRQMAERQQVLDEKSRGFGIANLASRTKSKAGSYYKNDSWDLVDASEQADFEISQVKEEDLPKEMQEMTVAERKAYIAGKRAEREKIKAEIQELSKKRDEFLAAKQRELAANDNTLGNQVQGAVREQAEAKGFKF